MVEKAVITFLQRRDCRDIIIYNYKVPPPKPEKSKLVDYPYGNDATTIEIRKATLSDIALKDVIKDIRKFQRASG